MRLYQPLATTWESQIIGLPRDLYPALPQIYFNLLPSFGRRRVDVSMLWVRSLAVSDPVTKSRVDFAGLPHIH